MNIEQWQKFVPKLTHMACVSPLLLLLLTLRQGKEVVKNVICKMILRLTHLKNLQILINIARNVVSQDILKVIAKVKVNIIMRMMFCMQIALYGKKS